MNDTLRMADADSSPIDVHIVGEPPDPTLGARLGALLRRVLEGEGLAHPCEVTVMFVGVEEMTKLNVEHMGGTGCTDVLSFPIDGAQPGEGDAPAVVGDVVVCASVATANAPDHAGTVEDELALLITHSALHLVGYDHATATDRREMWDRERAYLSRLWSPLTADPWRES